MQKYIVTIPITMSVSIEVEAESESSAVDAALATNFAFKPIGEDAVDIDIGEWSMHKIVAEGNIFRGVQNEVYVEEA